MLMPALPTSLANDDFSRGGLGVGRESVPREYSSVQDESMNTNFTDESNYYAGGATTGLVGMCKRTARGRCAETNVDYKEAMERNSSS